MLDAENDWPDFLLNDFTRIANAQREIRRTKKEVTSTSFLSINTKTTALPSTSETVRRLDLEPPVQQLLHLLLPHFA